MPPIHKFSELIVQDLPLAGILVRFRSRKLVGENLCAKIRQELESLVEPERLILADMSSVEHVGSNVLGVLIIIQKQLRHKAGALSLCGMHDHLEEVFRITRLSKLFDIYPSLEAALGDEASAP